MNNTNWTIIAQKQRTDDLDWPSFFADTADFDLTEFSYASDDVLSSVLLFIDPNYSRAVPLKDHLITIFETKPPFFFRGLLSYISTELTRGVQTNIPRWSTYDAGNAEGIDMSTPAEFVRFGIKLWQINIVSSDTTFVA